MNILALESTSDYCSVALLTNSSVIEKGVWLPQGHTRVLLPLCEDVLSEAGLTLPQLHGVAFARGPGAFTGVRIAVSAAQGIALGAGLPVFGVSSLAAMALGAVDTQRDVPITVAAALDARMNEVYWGLFTVDSQLSTATELAPECVCPPGDIPLPLPIQSILGAGPGWKTYAEPLRARFSGYDLTLREEVLPKASYVARLAKGAKAMDPASACPVYLRDRVVQTSANHVQK